MKIPRKLYTAEFKELTVKRIKDGQTYAAVAKDLQVVEKTLRNWVKAEQAGKQARRRWHLASEPRSDGAIPLARGGGSPQA